MDHLVNITYLIFYWNLIVAREWSPIGRTVYGVNLTPPSNRRGCPTLFHQWCTQWIFRLSSLVGQIWGENAEGLILIYVRHRINTSMSVALNWSGVLELPQTLYTGMCSVSILILTPQNLGKYIGSLRVSIRHLPYFKNLILQYTNKMPYKSSFFFVFLHFFLVFEG